MRSGSIYTYVGSRSAGPRRVAGTAAWLALVVGIGLDPSARAEAPGEGEDAWFVVTVVSDAGTDVARAAAGVRQRLASSGLQTLSSGEARALLEAAESADATPIAASDLDRWASRSRAALRFLSRGEYAEARRALLEAQAISERAADALNRETMRARQVLDTCLYVVRASLETGDVAGAEAQARRCRRLVPRMNANAYSHTPEVRELLARVDAELDLEAAGVLTVSSAPAGCSVRINGVYFGATPLSTSELPRGEYRVQVECDEGFPGRVHRITLDEADVAVRVDAAFERALRSSPEVSLAYPDAARARERAVLDATRLARSLHRPIFVVEPGAERWTLLTIDARGRRSASRSFARDDETEAEATILAVAGGRDVRGRASDEASEARDARASSDDDETTGDARGERRRRVAAYALVGIGAGAFATTAALLPVRAARGRTLDAYEPSMQGYLNTRSEYLRLRPVVVGSSLLFASTASTGLALLVRDARRPRPYGVIGGVLGLAFATYATVEFARAPICYGDAICTERDRAIDRAVVLASLSGPFLSLPLATLGRSDERGARVRVAGDRHRLALVLFGSLR